MAASEENRRKALKTAVAALSLEKGFDAVDKASLSVLAEIIQSCKLFIKTYFKYVICLFVFQTSTVIT